MIGTLFLLSLVGLCRATPFYVPESACDTMRPGILDTGSGFIGHVAQPQTGPSPYTFTYEFIEEEFAYKINISGVNGTTFRGFFVRAFDVFGDYGIFYPTDWEDETVQASGCVSQYDALSHTFNEDKTSITAYWIGAYEPIFQATIVKDTLTFWVAQDGVEITEQK